MLSGFNRKIYDFYDKVKVAFSINDFINIVKSVLEDTADFGAVWINTKNSSNIYSSPLRFYTHPDNIRRLIGDFKGFDNGIYFLSRSYKVVSNLKKAFVVMFSFQDYNLFLFSNYLALFDRGLFDEAYKEFGVYLKRVETIENMFSLSAISKEWALLAKTQKSFLSEKIPDINGLDINTYYEALVNVSGDYYDVIRIDDNKSLIILGDVAGKGLSAALIMGIIINTVKIVDKKDDLVKIIKLVDAAIKDMDFETRFTAMFLGLYDNSAKTLQFINAGIPEPWFVSDGVINPIPANCPLIGIIDLGIVQMETINLKPGDLLFIATDGLSEIENENRTMLGDSPDFKEMVIANADNSAEEISRKIVEAAKGFNPNGVIRDDIAFFVIKVKE